jgi:flagellar motor switch protein FliN/FliY
MNDATTDEREAAENTGQAEAAEARAPADEAEAARAGTPADEAEPVAFNDLTSELAATQAGDVNLDVILDVPVTLSMEVGRTRISIRNLLQLNQGSVVELDRAAGEALDVFVNGTLVAHGEVVVINEKFGIRLTDVISPAERVKKLK